MVRPVNKVICYVRALEVAEWDQVGFWNNFKSYLEALKRPKGYTEEAYGKLEHRLVGFYVEDEQLVRRHEPEVKIVGSNLATQA